MRAKNQTEQQNPAIIVSRESLRAKLGTTAATVLIAT